MICEIYFGIIISILIEGKIISPFQNNLTMYGLRNNEHEEWTFEKILIKKIITKIELFYCVMIVTIRFKFVKCITLL